MEVCEDYEAPMVEAVVSAKEMEREVLYAGTITEAA